MKRRLEALRASLSTGFWAIPSLCVALAVVVSLVLVWVDRRVEGDYSFTFGSGPDGAREVLSAITTAMITFTGLVFSITIVVLQLTSSQFSPRVLRTFLRDRQTQWSMGVFVATFVYAVMVLRTVDSTDSTRFVPTIATTFGLALLLSSVGVFVAYIHHIATAIQVTSVIRAIGDETRQTLDRRYPTGTGGAPDSHGLVAPAALATSVVVAPRSGVVTDLDETVLVSAASQAGLVLRVVVPIGGFVPEGAALVEVCGDGSLDPDEVAEAIYLDRDRTMQQDVSFGIRQLVDIAERALSPGINDPTTAVQCLDELHDVLRRLATRPLRSGLHLDRDGHVRLVVPEVSMADFLALALDEVQQYGEDAVAVIRRIRALLEEVAASALPEHRDAVLERLDRVPPLPAAPPASPAPPTP